MTGGGEGRGAVKLHRRIRVRFVYLETYPGNGGTAAIIIHMASNGGGFFSGTDFTFITHSLFGVLGFSTVSHGSTPPLNRCPHYAVSPETDCRLLMATKSRRAVGVRCERWTIEAYQKKALS